MTMTGGTQVERPSRVSLSGVALGAVATAALVGALAIRSSFVYGLVVLAAIFVPLERIFALRRQPILRRGGEATWSISWSTTSSPPC